ncbi:MAG: hypothetical protein HYT93_03220 [Parcubacteria group bacterium]|nr:hypothetical protein [Parcubacteria group bacterium]
MRRALIEGHIRKLSDSLGGIRPPVTGEILYVLHAKKDFAGMVKYIARALKVNCKIRIDYVNCTDDANAKIGYPEHISPFGTREFRNTKVTLYLHQAFLRAAPCDMVIFAIAHEFSHVVLASIGHELKSDEVAADLTAMILGFRYFYLSGNRYDKEGNQFETDIFLKLWREFNKRLLGHVYIHVTCGYLTMEEIQFGCSLMEEIEKTQHKNK